MYISPSTWTDPVLTSGPQRIATTTTTSTSTSTSSLNNPSTPPLLSLLFTSPATLIILAFLIGLYVYHWRRRVEAESVAMSYRKVVGAPTGDTPGEWWRLATSTVSHGSFMHILFNAWSLYSLAGAEAMLGTATYCRVTFILMITTSLLHLGLLHVIVFHLGLQTHEYQFSLGYSGVIFGWMTVVSQLNPTARLQLIGGFSLPAGTAPFAYLLITQVLVRRASFLGHLSGILAGFLAVLGVFDWLTPYWFFTSVLYVLVGLLINVRATTSVTLPCIDVSDSRGTTGACAPSNALIQNGVLRRSRRGNTVLAAADEDIDDDELLAGAGGVAGGAGGSWV